MVEAKIEFSIGKISFSGEGTETWLAKQLEFLLTKLPDLLVMPGAEPEVGALPAEAQAAEPPVQVGSLASHIKAKGGESNQVKRFMATADWLRAKGESTLKTAMVSKALADNHQKKLSNPADCLNQSVGKGHCEKKADGFFITPEGMKALGYND